ncbi:MAG: hypothetical protein KDA31_14165 [Phycisphaerales bacterium]|nr:hypothetical protein [Phycisphaerales bacterium]MCB9837484.1 hypothetical protein [Phycisphaera sp.]
MSVQFDERPMTEAEREVFVARRKQELWAYTAAIPLIAVLYFAVPALFLAALASGVYWALSLVLESARLWASFPLVFGIIAILMAIVVVLVLIRGYQWAVERTNLPEDASLRMLTIDRDTLRECMLGCVPTKHQKYPRARIVHLELPELGRCVIPIEDPAEGELRTNEEGCLRVGWSPLRRYFVEWVDVPAEWPGSLPVIRGEIPQGAHHLSSLLHLERLRTMISTGEGDASPSAEP